LSGHAGLGGRLPPVRGRGGAGAGARRASHARAAHDRGAARWAGADHTGLKPRFGELSDVAQIVYYDHRGQGRSDRSAPDRWNHDQWADDLVALCDALGIVEPVVFGVSFGAIVALHYAVRHPGHAGRLILDSGAAVADNDERLAMFGRLGGPEAVAAAVAFFDHADAETLTAYFTTCMPLYSRHTPPDAAEQRARGMPHANFDVFRHWQAGEERTYDLRGSLDRITCPVLVLAGEDDPICPAVGSRANRRRDRAGALHAGGGARLRARRLAGPARRGPARHPGLPGGLSGTACGSSRRARSAAPVTSTRWWRCSRPPGARATTRWWSGRRR
jgi:proline iminopeptidase